MREVNPNIDHRLIWLNGKIVPLQDAKINVLSPTSQFGANVFEGIRCYWNEDHQQLYAFRLPDHYRRLKNSMKLFRMEDRYSIEKLQEGLVDVVRANGYREDIAVRQTVFIEGFGSWMSQGPIGMFIAPIPRGRTLERSKLGFRCCVSSWERISDRNLSPRAKVGANYINSRMAEMEALANGYDSSILMNDQGKIAEGPGSCIFIVRDGVLITPPITASILESITRDTIIKLARGLLDTQVIERNVDRTELYICDEAFLCGSAMEVVPVLSVDGIPVGTGLPGELTQSIQRSYLSVASARVAGFSEWLTSIY